MDLNINIFGTKVSCKKERIVLSFPTIEGVERPQEEYSIRQIEKIIIFCPVSLTSSAILLAWKYDVDVSFQGYLKPYGRFVSSTPKGLAATRRAQLETAISTEKTIAFAKLIVKVKCLNQINYMCYWAEFYGKDLSSEIKQAKVALESVDDVPATEKGKEKLRGIEGHVATRYYYALRKLFIFSGRKPRGRDKFNSALNYGYGIMYNEIGRACFGAGLDPTLGIFHAEGYGKASLEYDLVEEFRVTMVDSVIFPLFIEDKIDREKCFKRIDQYSFELSKKGKSLILKIILARLNEKFPWKGQNLALKAIIKDQSRSIAKAFQGNEHYTPFRSYFKFNMPLIKSK
jgi:CRISP-associated protein Cas1